MAFLQILSAGPEIGRRLDVATDETTLGRAPDNRLPIEDPSSSSHHCVILRSDRKYTLRDLGSTNGTLLNGMTVKESRLNPGDVITVGAMEILFDGEDIEPDAMGRSAGSGVPITKTVVLGRTGATVAPSAFGARKSTRGLWIAAGVVIGLGLAALIYWFLDKLYS